MVGKPANCRTIEIAMRFAAQIHIIELRRFYRHLFEDCFQFLLREAAGSRDIHRIHAFTSRHNTGFRHTNILVTTHAEVAWQLIDVSAVNLQSKFRRILDDRRSLSFSRDFLYDCSWCLCSPRGPRQLCTAEHNSNGNREQCLFLETYHKIFTPLLKQTYALYT